jgi:hypothetical protein
MEGYLATLLYGSHDVLAELDARGPVELPTAVLTKTTTEPKPKTLSKGAPLQLFMRLSKIDEEQRLVYGVAASEAPDRQNEILDYEGSKPYFKAWSESVQKDSQGASLGNLREMHGLSAVGTLAEIEFNDSAKQIEVCAKITDDRAWSKVLSRTYTGFSVGGRYVDVRKESNGLMRYIADPSELSLVDRPAVPDATFQLVKADGSKEICKFKEEPKMSTEAKWKEEHHRDHAAHLGKTAAHHRAMMAIPGKSKEEIELHKDHAEHCEAEQAKHLSHAEKCAKSATAEDLSKVSGVTPGVRAVPRHGQPVPEKLNVDSQFADLFKVEHTEDRSVTKSIG